MGAGRAREHAAGAGPDAVGWDAAAVRGPGAGPLLLTPGPLTTPAAVRAAMGRDWGSRDPAFVALSEGVRARLAALGGPGRVCVPLQGSGSFAVEAMLSTFCAGISTTLVCINGAYGERALDMLRRMGRPGLALRAPETEAIDPAAVAQALAQNPQITHVVVIYSETTAGVRNPLAAISAAVADAGRALLVDAMSAFGVLPLDGVEYQALAASSNKGLEGPPGLAFVLADPIALAKAEGRAGSLVLDLYGQWRRFEQDGQWRFTPPVQLVAALSAALDIYEAEGGLPARGRRYADNCATLCARMDALGFRRLVAPALQAPVIVTFAEPEAEGWDFWAVYNGLVDAGFAIYPGKLTAAPSFRVGCIGELDHRDLHAFVDALEGLLRARGLHLPLTERAPA